MTRRNAALVGAAILIPLLVTACSVGGQPQAAPLAVSPAVVTITTTTVQVPSSEPAFAPPDGFDDWGDRVGAKWSDQTTFTCPDSSDSCWGVDLYSERGCPGGILVVLDVFRDQTKLAVIDETTAAVAPGATSNLVLGQTGNGTGLTAKIATISCRP